MKTMLSTLGLIACTAMSSNAQNLLDNGSFEDLGPGFVLFEGWENYGNIFQADMGEVIAQDGSFTGKMFGASSGAQSDQVLTQSVAAESGELYTLSGYAQNLSSDPLGAENVILFQMVFQDGAGNTIEAIETPALNPSTSPMDEWVYSELSGIAPAGTMNVAVYLLHIQLGTDQGFPTQGGGASFWDNVTLIGGEAPCSNPADFNGDGTLNFFDISAFLAAYSNGC